MPQKISNFAFLCFAVAKHNQSNSHSCFKTLLTYFTFGGGGVFASRKSWTFLKLFTFLNLINSFLIANQQCVQHGSFSAAARFRNSKAQTAQTAIGFKFHWQGTSEEVRYSWPTVNHFFSGCVFGHALWTLRAHKGGFCSFMWFKTQGGGKSRLDQIRLRNFECVPRTFSLQDFLLPMFWDFYKKPILFTFFFRSPRNASIRVLALKGR